MNGDCEAACGERDFNGSVVRQGVKSGEEWCSATRREERRRAVQQGEAESGAMLEQGSRKM